MLLLKVEMASGGHMGAAGRLNNRCRDCIRLRLPVRSARDHSLNGLKRSWQWSCASQPIRSRKRPPSFAYPGHARPVRLSDKCWGVSHS